LTPALRTQQRDAECDPRALEHEQAEVVERGGIAGYMDIESDGDEDARGCDDPDGGSEMSPTIWPTSFSFASSATSA